MRPWKINAILVLASLSFILSGLSLWMSWGDERIAFVRSQELIYKYQGMKEAHARYEERKKELERKVDTVERSYQRMLEGYEAEKEELAQEEMKEREKALRKEREHLERYSRGVQQKLKEYDEEVTGGVLNQVNSFAEEFGEEHGYDLIIGASGDGKVLYGDDALDVTDRLLEALNENYSGTKAEDGP